MPAKTNKRVLIKRLFLYAQMTPGRSQALPSTVLPIMSADRWISPPVAAPPGCRPSSFSSKTPSPTLTSSTPRALKTWRRMGGGKERGAGGNNFPWPGNRAGKAAAPSPYRWQQPLRVQTCPPYKGQYIAFLQYYEIRTIHSRRKSHCEANPLGLIKGQI